MSNTRIGAVILAAGKGTRLKTERPKVLHEVLGRPMLAHVFDACHGAGVHALVGVVGYRQELVREAFLNEEEVTWVEQIPQNGTGHAVKVCRDVIAERFDHVLVLCGDGPLIRAETLRQLVDQHLDTSAVTTLATAVLEDPTGYGRIDRDAEGRLIGIVEHADATDVQREIREINPSYYCFRAEELLGHLDRLSNDNAKGEYYLTDCIAMAIDDGHRVQAITAVPPDEIYSINTRQQLSHVNHVMRDRVLRDLQNSGVTIIDPDTTWIDPRAVIGVDTVIEPLTSIRGVARIGTNCRIGPMVALDGDVVEDNGVVGPNHSVSGGVA